MRPHKTLLSFATSLTLALSGLPAAAQSTPAATDATATTGEDQSTTNTAADSTRPRQASETRPDREVGSPPPPSETGSGFAFGSYGRVGVGLDGRGHEGYGVNVVSHGSRLEEPPYLELDFYYGGRVGSGRWRAVIAPAFGGDLFHYTGDFSSHFALRNGYVETEDLGAKGLRFWAGSRMYRGDDVYLFDYWPLDNLNTVGGGAGWKFGDNDIAVHVGLNRLNDPFQYQTQGAPPHGLGPAISAVVVDRPRLVATAKYTHYFLSQGGAPGLKLSAYTELHFLPEAVHQFQNQDQRVEQLPSETGYVIGGQIGMWLRPFTFANLFVRYATGIGVFGDLSLPQTLSPPRAASNAREIVGALSLNYETRHIGVMAGAFVRSYRDPDPSALSVRDYVEGALAIRPQVYLTKWFHVAGEVSYQARSFAGFDPYLDRRLAPHVTRFSLMPIIAPLGPGTYSRPALYLVYTVSLLNDDARDTLFDPTDVRYGGGFDPKTLRYSGSNTVQYIGVGAEWWFQSSYR